jgi:hypothetical protein
MNLLGLIMRFNPPPQLEALDNVQATAQIGAGSQSFAAFGMLPKGGADNRNAFLKKKSLPRRNTILHSQATKTRTGAPVLVDRQVKHTFWE